MAMIASSTCTYFSKTYADTALVCRCRGQSGVAERWPWYREAMPISGEVYKQLGSSAAGPVSVVAAFDRSSDKIVGLTVSSFVTLSFDPPLVMFAIQHSADSYSSMVSSHAFGVSLLQTGQDEIATLFATKGADKTGKSTFEEGNALHVPLIPDALAHIECL